MQFLTSGRNREPVSGWSFRAWTITAALAFLLVAAASSNASHLFSDTAGHTTLETVLVGGNPSVAYSNLQAQSVTRQYVVRDGSSEADPRFPTAESGREGRRGSLNYFAQLTDFQLADEESPARVEFLDPGASSAWRPWEALMPFMIDLSLRQVNAFSAESPVPQGDGSRAALDFALMTGDQADSSQRNELLWTRELLEGGQPLNFNSGSTNPAAYDPTVHPSCANYPPSNAHRDEALRYTGVQDYDDYDESTTPLYYDPDDVRGSWATKGWPTYNGLMDRAQQLTITPAGLFRDSNQNGTQDAGESDVPSYVTNGNHDSLVQGNEDANEAFEDIATGCAKMLASTATPGPGVLDPNVLLAPAASSTLVPPDPLRRYVSKPQIKAIYGQDGADDAHGYDFVDPAEEAASNDSASYYAWDPPQAPGFRYISIDTVSEGGQTAEGVGAGSSSGNIDDPQFQWLRDELDAATADDKLIVIFGHHPVRSMNTEIVDEQAALCTTQHNHGDTPEHDRNPGCDLDPRPSTPIHLGEDPQAGDPRESFVELLSNYDHVLAYVPGHTHENKVHPCGRAAGCPAGSAWWELNTAAVADWPNQHRLVEVMDNNDGTLSIFGTVLDHAGAATAPPACSTTGCAGTFTNEQLASIARTLSYNDPQSGFGTPSSGQGAAKDNNVELLVRDPRAYPRPNGAAKVRTTLVPSFDACGSPNTAHGPPLDEGSCGPAQPSSDYLTVPNDDTSVANGSLTLRVVCTNAETPPCPAAGDQADVRLNVTANDVRQLGTPDQYAGELEGRMPLRITDGNNGPTGSQAATMVDSDFSFGVPCEPNAGGQGSSCSLVTTLDVLKPGVVRENERAIWELGQLEVYDGGSDGAALTTSDNTPFLRQAIFVP